jgi:hypothetical protein
MNTRGYATNPNEQDTQSTYAAKAKGSTTVDAPVPTISPDKKKSDQKKQVVNEVHLDDETEVSGNTATMMGTNFAQWQEMMMRTMQTMFQAITVTVMEVQTNSASSVTRYGTSTRRKSQPIWQRPKSS